LEKTLVAEVFKFDGICSTAALPDLGDSLRQDHSGPALHLQTNAGRTSHPPGAVID